MSRVSDRELAVAMILEMASGLHTRFGPLGFYDNDAEIIEGIIDRVNGMSRGLKGDGGISRRLMRVANRLQDFGVFSGKTAATNKEYFGEPAKQKTFWFRNPSLHWSLNPEINPRYVPRSQSSIDEVNFQLRHAYPTKD